MKSANLGHGASERLGASRDDLPVAAFDAG